MEKKDSNLTFGCEAGVNGVLVYVYQKVITSMVELLPPLIVYTMLVLPSYLATLDSDMILLIPYVSPSQFPL